VSFIRKVKIIRQPEVQPSIRIKNLGNPPLFSGGQK
jgi:hypothetical protein